LTAYSIPFLRKLCDSSFYYFVKIIGGSVPDAGGDINEHIHKVLCDFWQDPSLKRKAIFMPRGWFKSTVFTKWGTLWKYLRNNESRILIASENERNATRFLDFIEKQVLNNELLRKVYPELQAVNVRWTQTHRWSSEHCDLPHKGIYSEANITSIGVGGAAQSGHYTDIHIDDLVGKKAMESALVMEGIYAWQDNVQELLVNPNFNSPSGSQVGIVGTHWSAEDYGCYVQREFPEYQWLIVPALKDETLEDDEDRPNVKWLQHPDVAHEESNYPNSPDDKYSTEVYIKMMASREEQIKFWSQHQNNPRKMSGLNKFNYDWLNWYSLEDREDGKWVICQDDKEEFKLSKIQLWGMIDPHGFSETKLIKGGARTAIVVGGQPYGSRKKFIFYAWAGRPQDPKIFKDEVFAANELFKPRGWRIDTAAQQGYIMKDLVLEAKKRGVLFRITPLRPDTRRDSKDYDIQSLIMPGENGEFYIRKSFTDLIKEWVAYPTGLTKDLLDCMGKLNVSYWHRKEKKEPDNRQVYHFFPAEGVSQVTKY